jgi:hypothetical protein
MFFGRKRRKVTDGAVAAMRPLIALAQQAGGMSLEMWHDPYLMGYLSFTASFFGRNEVQGKMSPVDLGLALQDAFSIVSNMNGAMLVKQNVEFHDTQNPSFQKGLDDAATVTFYTIGQLNNESSNPLVLECAEIGAAYANAMGDSDVRTSIASAMMQATFIKQIKTLRGAH